MLNNVKNWVNKNEKQKHIKVLLIYLVIVFIVGITTKIIAASYGTNDYFWLISQKDLSKNNVDIYNKWLASLPAGTPDTATGPISSAIDQWTTSYNKYSDGATDQSIGMYIGWAMIALKLWIYVTTFIVIIKALTTKESLPVKYYKFMFLRFITLFIGLIVGEALTIYFTMRNPVDMNFWVVFSFFSPALSIAFAVGALPYIYKVIKNY